ncbi:hypothetical protein DPMN_125778 [Dreissena polymorpha]|uniref:Uncharacterized protein n=2 Tax=Dreissena polymorpha TaxID=45954 RepID=A0A9D4JXI4_DREPO|nr:hypothetical protein DPMN_125778 [Dreissena polymorpha]
MSMSELARHSPQLDIRDLCRITMSELDIRPSSLIGTSAECRCQSWLDIRPSSIFGTRAKCRCQSWRDISSISKFETCVECRCQSCLDIRHSSLFVGRIHQQFFT